MKLKAILATAVALSVSGAASAATDADVDQSFFPYRDYTPSYEGLESGMVLNADNVAAFEGALDPAMYQYIKDGQYEMTVMETTSFDLHPSYVQATRDNLDSTSLGDSVGAINGWVAGRPFVGEPDMDDPRAGEKLPPRHG